MQYKILKSLEKTEFGGKFSVEKLLILAPNGVEAEMYMRSGGDFAIVIPLLSSGEIVMVEQLRLGLEEHSLEFPMGQVTKADGTIVKDQEIADIELKEETGYTAGRMTFLGAYHPAPGWSTQRALVYVAQELVEGNAEPEPLEFITVKTVTTSQLDNMIKNDKIINFPTIAAYHIFKLKFAEKLR